MSKLRMLFLAAFAAVTLGIGSSPALAIQYFFPFTGFEDDDIEFLVNQGATTGTIIDVGDRLVGVAEFNFSHSIPPGAEAAIAPQELTAVFDLTVTGKSCLPGNNVCQFTFGPTGAGGVLASQPAGTAVTLYLDNVDDLNLVTVNCNSLANCVDLANNGSVFLDGLITALNPATGWTATSTDPLGLGRADDVAFVSALNATQNGGIYNFCLDAGTNNTGFNLGTQTCGLGLTQIAGGGTIKGGQGLTNGAFGRSDNDFQIRPIPEPSSMLLLGAGLLGLGVIGRRTRKK